MLTASTLVAISGMLAATEPPARAGGATAAVEISFVTHAGEGAEGQKRFTRDGCYQAESGGSTGGAAYAFESQAGCHRTADVAAVFARLDAIPTAALVREARAKGGGAPQRGPTLGGAETRVVLIRTDGTRWMATNQATADDVLRAVNELPGENQWHMPAPDKPVGSGPQLLALMTAVGKGESSWRFEGSLASDGRWWCHRSTVGTRTGASRLPTKNSAPIANAPARLGRILAGAQPDAREEPQAAADKHADEQISVESAWPGKARAPLRPAKLAGTVLHRFIGEMRTLSPVCEVR